MIKLTVSDSAFPEWMAIDFNIPMQAYRDLLPTLRKYQNVKEEDYQNMKEKEEITEKFLAGKITQDEWNKEMLAHEVVKIDNYHDNKEQKKLFELSCVDCTRKILVKIPVSTWERQEIDGTLETFRCKCDRYHRLSKHEVGFMTHYG